MNPMRKMVEETIWKIRAEIISSDFDCRNLLFKYDHPEYAWNMTEEFRKGYIVPKYAVAKILQPRRICEIGVYNGIAAMAFLAACPSAEYVGLDNLSGEKTIGVPLVEMTVKRFKEYNYDTKVIIDNSQMMDRLPDWPYDLIHVDGCHTRECAKHDVKLAFEAVSKDGWILIDDACDPHVCAGVFEALEELPGGNMYWTVIEGTTSSILFYRTRQ